MSIHANEKQNQGYSYLKYTKTTNDTGKVSRDYVEYTDLPLLFVPLSRFRKLDSDGQIMRGTSECIIRAKWFTDNGIEPEADDFVVDHEGGRYRVMGLEDYRQFTQCWYLYLRGSGN